jgi:hypothetical protein
MDFDGKMLEIGEDFQRRSLSFCTSKKIQGFANVQFEESSELPYTQE